MCCMLSFLKSERLYSKYGTQMLLMTKGKTSVSKFTEEEELNVDIPCIQTDRSFERTFHVPIKRDFPSKYDALIAKHTPYMTVRGLAGDHSET